VTLTHDAADEELGMVTAPTPFITSRPHTLFYNDSTRSSGAVGLVMNKPLSVDAEFGLEPLTDRTEVIA
jgi:hypothetical protein